MAEQLTLNAEARPAEGLGTRKSRRYRKEGKIPAVLAHKSETPVNLLVDGREFGKILRKHARIITLAHPGGTDKVFIRQVQFDHIDENMLHVDFTRVAMDEKLALEVPLTLKGKPVGVTEEGGVLDQYVKMLKIECLPDAIPDLIEADVSGLAKDVKFTVKDLKPPEGVTVLQEPDLLLAIVQEHKVEEVAPAAAPGPLEPEVIKPERAEEGAAEGGEKGEKKEKEKKE